jgi:hypothetical protein
MPTTTVAPVTATATFSRLALAIVAALALVSAAALAGCGSAGKPAASQTRGFAWLRPSSPPRAWRTSRLQDGAASLAYPLSWSAIQSDPGTVSAAVRRKNGAIRGYLNATPQQGAETLADWSSFRLDHNRDEGDVNVTAVASATNLRFHGAHGSCVVDDYTSSTGHRYREIACIVAGATDTTVVVGAAPPASWQAQAPAIERAISSFVT